MLGIVETRQEPIGTNQAAAGEAYRAVVELDEAGLLERLPLPGESLANVDRVLASERGEVHLAELEQQDELAYQALVGA